MSQKMLDCIEITTTEQCEYTVIWLHGLGASGHDFEPIVPELQLLQRPGIRFLFPHAPVRPITVNGGAAMRGWYDITSADFGNREQDVKGIQDSAQQVAELMDNEISRGVPAGKIILAGFSQGGAIALYAGLTGEHTPGGILALSTYLPIQDQTLSAIRQGRSTMPIFMAHGLQDDVIQIQHAEQSRQVLEQHNESMEWHTYEMPHSISADEVTDISSWLKRQFGM